MPCCPGLSESEAAVRPSSPVQFQFQSSQQPPPHRTGRRRQRLVSPSRRPAAVKRGLIWRGRRAQRRTLPKPSITCRKDQADGDHPGRSSSPSKSAAPLPACLPPLPRAPAHRLPTSPHNGRAARAPHGVGSGSGGDQLTTANGVGPAARAGRSTRAPGPGSGTGPWASKQSFTRGVLQFARRLAATPRPVDHHHPPGAVPSTPQLCPHGEKASSFFAWPAACCYLTLNPPLFYLLIVLTTTICSWLLPRCLHSFTTLFFLNIEISRLFRKISMDNYIIQSTIVYLEKNPLMVTSAHLYASKCTATTLDNSYKIPCQTV